MIEYKNSRIHQTAQVNYQDISEQGLIIASCFDHYDHAVLIINKYLGVDWYNKKALEICAEILNLPVTDYSTTESETDTLKKSIVSNIQKALTGKKSSFEEEIIKKKCTIWFEFSFLPIFNSRYEVKFILFKITDVSNTKTTLKSLQLHDSILEAVSYTAETFLRTSDFDKSLSDVFGRIGSAAKVQRIELIKFFQCEDNHNIFFEWVSSPNYILTNAHENELNIRKWMKAFIAGKIIHSVFSIASNEEKEYFSKYRIQSYIAVPVFVGIKYWGYVSFIDYEFERKWTITELDTLKMVGQIIGAELQRINFEKDLIIAKEEAEKSTRLKTEFLTQMSHEIRTPLNSILSFTELLRDELEQKVDDDLRSCFKMIDSGGRRLIRTIDMILNMSLLQSDSYEYKPSNVDLAKKFLKEIILEFRQIAAEKNLEINFKNMTDEATVFLDEYTLRQIFLNLIDNAVKYTKRGKVEIILYRNLKNEICIDIKDTGIGISKEYLPVLFTPFTQEEMGYSRKYEGNGLGLALVKKYLEMNNARINVVSEKYKGSTFTVILTNNEQSKANKI